MAKCLTDIILIKSKSREYEYGVGSFLANLILGLSSKKNIRVYYIDLSKRSEGLSWHSDSCLTTISLPFTLTSDFFEEGNIDKNRTASRLVSNILKEKFDINSPKIIINSPIEYQVALDLKETLNGKMMFVVHTATKQNKFPYDLELRDFFDKFDNIVFPSNYCKNFYKGLAGKSFSNAIVIYNGIGLPQKKKLFKHEICSEFGLSTKDNILLFVGRVDFQKGVPFLLKAFKTIAEKYKNWKLVLVGNGEVGDYLPFCKGFYSSVIFTGFLPKEFLVKLYSIAKIGIIPSINENFSYTALEMSSYKIPVIATNVGGLPEIYRHNKSGMLSRVDKKKRGYLPNIDALAKNIELLITNSELKKQISINAYQSVQSRFTAEIMAKKYLSV